MKRVLAIALVGLLAVPVFAQDEEAAAGGPQETIEAQPADEVKAAPAPDARIETDDQRFSYIVGTRFGRSFKDHPADIDYLALVRGIYDAMHGGKLAIDDESADKFLAGFLPQLNARRKEKIAALAEANLKAGKEFLEKNGKLEGVTTTASGLQYRMIEQGDGPKPQPTDTVKVHYVGKDLKGNVFDSSRARGEPAAFAVTDVIAGWTEGLQLMPVGSKYEFFIPSELGYKEKGSGRSIEPNATLIFEVELLEIVNREPDAKTEPEAGVEVVD